RNGYNGTPTPGGRNSQGIFADAGRHHRRPAELAVRLAPYPAVNNGHPLAVAVRMEALHFFDDRGQRIDVGWREPFGSPERLPRVESRRNHLRIKICGNVAVKELLCESGDMPRARRAGPS